MLICTHVPSLKNNIELVKIKFVGDTLPILIFYNAILIFITLRFNYLKLQTSFGDLEKCHGVK